MTCSYPEPRRLQLQLQPTRRPEETQLQPGSSGEVPSAPCLFQPQNGDFNMTNSASDWKVSILSETNNNVNSSTVPQVLLTIFRGFQL